MSLFNGIFLITPYSIFHSAFTNCSCIFLFSAILTFCWPRFFLQTPSPCVRQHLQLQRRAGRPHQPGGGQRQSCGQQRWVDHPGPAPRDQQSPIPTSERASRFLKESSQAGIYFVIRRAQVKISSVHITYRPYLSIPWTPTHAPT